MAVSDDNTSANEMLRDVFVASGLTCKTYLFLIFAFSFYWKGFRSMNEKDIKSTHFAYYDFKR